MGFTVHAYVHDPATASSYGDEAVAALGVPAEQVFKTLVVDTGTGLVVGVVPVPSALDLKALAFVLGAKRVGLAAPADAERSTGYVLGGISPLGQRRRLPTVVDASAGRWDRVYVSAGRRGLDIALAPEDLLEVTGGRTAAIAR